MRSSRVFSSGLGGARGPARSRGARVLALLGARFGLLEAIGLALHGDDLGMVHAAVD